MRFFNTTGPCVPGRHYMLPAAERLPEARALAEGGRYFVVYAPRQTGKITAMNSLAEELNAGGRRVALQVSCEVGEPWGDDIAAVELALLDTIRVAAKVFLPPEFRPPDPWPDAPPGTRLSDGLMDWAVACPLPLVLILDEIDALRGRSLISVLRQLRNGFRYKAQAFPRLGRAAGCAISGTTRPRRAATRRGSAPRARSTSWSSRCASRTSAATRSPRSTGSTRPTPARSSCPRRSTGPSPSPRASPGWSTPSRTRSSTRCGSSRRPRLPSSTSRRRRSG